MFRWYAGLPAGGRGDKSLGPTRLGATGVHAGREGDVYTAWIWNLQTFPGPVSTVYGLVLKPNRKELDDKWTRVPRMGVSGSRITAPMRYVRTAEQSGDVMQARRRNITLDMWTRRLERTERTLQLNIGLRCKSR